MAAERNLLAKEDRRETGEQVDIPFLILTLLLLAVGLAVFRQLCPERL